MTGGHCFTSALPIFHFLLRIHHFHAILLTGGDDMKKTVFLFIVLMVIILLAGCQQQNSSVDNTGFFENTSSVDANYGDVADINFYYYFEDECFAECVASAMNKDPSEAVTEEELANFSGKISVLGQGESLAGIGYLKSITELSVAKCSVEEIPSEIFHCKKLKRLDLLKAFDLKKLPENIGELKELEYIDVALTSIENIPESIGNLKNLKYFYGSATSIASIPESIGNCEGLIILDLHSTDIKKIPESVTNLKNLKSLDLGYTKVTSLPENIGALSQLVRLDLFRLDLRRLPQSTKNLVKLEYLNVYDNYNLNEEYKLWFENECYKCVTDPENNSDWDDGR